MTSSYLSHLFKDPSLNTITLWGAGASDINVRIWGTQCSPWQYLYYVWAACQELALWVWKVTEHVLLQGWSSHLGSKRTKCPLSSNVHGSLFEIMLHTFLSVEGWKLLWFMTMFHQYHSGHLWSITLDNVLEINYRKKRKKKSGKKEQNYWALWENVK